MRTWFLVVFAGCSGSGVGDTSNPTDPTDTDDGPATVVEPETQCDDQLDDDNDGATDCNDSDCFEVELCTWPTTLQFSTQIDYEASFEASLFGYDDCTIIANATITRDRNQTCPGADRVFCGTLSYVSDDCPAEFDRPVTACYALAFADDASWPIWYVNPETSGWQTLGNGTPDGTGGMRYVGSTPLDYEGTDVGDLTTAFTFRE